LIAGHLLFSPFNPFRNRRKHVVLVALTSFGQDSDRQKSIAAGFTHHLVKPARFEELQKILALVTAHVVPFRDNGSGLSL
jgi:CheY-like chemotaxis protein